MENEFMLQNSAMPDGDYADAYLAAMPPKVRTAMLYGVYGPLLNDNRRRILSLFVDEDYSLSEIAEEEGISRQGVHDSIRRSEELLQDHEKKLGVLRRLIIQERILRRCEIESLPLPGTVGETFAALRHLWEENPWPLKD